MVKKKKIPDKTCDDCIHEHACRGWAAQPLSPANAEGCPYYEAIRESTAYFIGFREGRKENASGEAIAFLELAKNFFDEQNRKEDGE